jgi:hypothetical protein
MKLLTLALILATYHLFPSPIAALDNECSMRRADGTIVNLGKLCGTPIKPENPQPTPAKPIKEPIKEPVKEATTDNCSKSKIANYIASFSTKNERVGFEALVKCKGKSVPALIEASTKFVKTENFSSLIPMLLALQKIGKEAVPALIVKTKDSDPKVRIFAITMLSAIIDSKDTIPSLINAVKDSNQKVSLAAINALIIRKQLGENAQNVLPTLITLLQSPNDTNRYEVINALRKIGKPSVPILITVLKDSDRKYSLDDRRSAIFGLRDIGKDAYEAIPVLTDALKDPDTTIRYTAEGTLNEIRKR